MRVRARPLTLPGARVEKVREGRRQSHGHVITTRDDNMAAPRKDIPIRDIRVLLATGVGLRVIMQAILNAQLATNFVMRATYMDTSRKCAKQKRKERKS